MRGALAPVAFRSRQRRGGYEENRAREKKTGFRLKGLKAKRASVGTRR